MFFECVMLENTGWNILSLGISLLVMLAIVTKMIGMVKTYRFFRSLPGNEDHSFLYGHLHKVKGKINKNRRLDFIDILLSARDEEGNPMTTLEIRNEVATFMFAGHDTTATAIPWALYTLAKHKEYQGKVQKEVDSIVKGRDRPDILWQDLSKFEMLSLCNKETLRLYPLVPLLQRDLDADMDIDGHKIPAGTTVTIVVLQLHRNPAVWDEPHEFRPERFQTENKSTLDPFAFISFAAGSRNCIGQNFALNEEKVLLARIFQRYNVTLAPDAGPPRRKSVGILRSEKGIWLRLQRR